MTTVISEAFRLLRTTHPAAATLVVEATPQALRLHAVRGVDGELLWFDEDSYSNHPDAAALGGSPELDYGRDVIGHVETLLLTAADDAFTTADDRDYLGLWRPEGRTLFTVKAG